MSLRNPLARARGLGSAKEGVQHWWMQRLSSIGLFFLVPWFAIFAIGLVGADHEAARLAVAEPLNAVLLALLSGTLFYHAWLGVQVVVEDYFHTRWVELSLLVFARFAFLIAAVASIFAIIRIALGVG